jgi:hypothetical protein
VTLVEGVTVELVVAVAAGSTCDVPGSFSFASKAARAAAWAGVSSARTETVLAPKAMHKPKKILIFIKLSIFIGPLRAGSRPTAFVTAGKAHFGLDASAGFGCGTISYEIIRQGWIRA